LTTSQKKELRKSFWPFFGSFWRIFDKNYAANLFGCMYFLMAPFELCGRKFGQLATLAFFSAANNLTLSETVEHCRSSTVTHSWSGTVTHSGLLTAQFSLHL
jgi:hypothetical protein